MIENVASDLLKVYTSHLNKVENDVEFFTIVTAMLVFRHLAMMEALSSSTDESDGNVDDIELLLNEKAKQIALDVRARALAQSVN